MEPTPAPWRVLEDPMTAAAGSTESVSPPTGMRRLARSTLLAIGGAGALAVAAFALAFTSGGSGTVAVVGGTSFDSQTPGSTSAVAASGAARAGDGQLVVEIVGAVSHPGVFRMTRDARVGDLLTAAGGYGPRVDAARAGRELNLAAPLHDGDQVRVPSRDDAPVATAGSAGGTASGGGSVGSAVPVDLNHATASDLDAIPGIGPATAAKILASRDGQAFVAVEDLRTRKLVGQKTFDGLKDRVTVR